MLICTDIGITHRPETQNRTTPTKWLETVLWVLDKNAARDVNIQENAAASCYFCQVFKLDTIQSCNWVMGTFKYNNDEWVRQFNTFGFKVISCSRFVKKRQNPASFMNYPLYNWCAGEAVMLINGTTLWGFTLIWSTLGWWPSRALWGTGWYFNLSRSISEIIVTNIYDTFHLHAEMRPG